MTHTLSKSQSDQFSSSLNVSARIILPSNYTLGQLSPHQSKCKTVILGTEPEVKTSRFVVCCMDGIVLWKNLGVSLALHGSMGLFHWIFDYCRK